MANYATLTAWIEAYIKTNGQQEITAQVLQTTLKKMVTTLGDGFRLAGVATPDGTPAATDNDIYYLAAEAGTYTNYGGAVLDGSTLHLLTYSSEWGDIDTGVATATALAAVAQALGADIEAVAEAKADKASSNPAMLVGSALGIMGNTPQSALYTHRAVPAGAGNGAAQFRVLRGRSIVWDQLIQNGDFATTDGWFANNATLSAANNTLSVTSTSTSSVFVSHSITLNTSHKYYISLRVYAAQGGDMVIAVNDTTADTLTAVAGWNTFNALLSDFPAGSDIKFYMSRLFSQVGDVCQLKDIQLYDLTAAGKDSMTADQFKDWLNTYYPGFHGYNSGAIKNLMATGIKTKDADNNDLYTLALNIPTLKGKAGGVGESVVIYPNGMMSAGTAYDYGRVDADGWMRKVTAAVGNRAYQDGDESDATLLTDGTTTNYPLATPVEYVLDTPIYMGYPVDADGTETMLPDQTALSEPSSAPIDYDVVYPIQTATPSDIATSIAAAKAEEVTALNAMLTANELGGEFSVDEDGVLTYTPGE